MDIFENQKELTLMADVPVVRPEDVDLRYEKGELLLHACVQPHATQGTPLLSEFDIALGRTTAGQE